MTFNELNSVEHYIIQKLSCVNLNSGSIDNNLLPNKWKYKSSDKINRDIKDVLIEAKLREALILLNTEILKTL